MNLTPGAPPLVHTIHDAQSILPVWLAWAISAALIVFWVGLLVTIAWLILRRFISKPVTDPNALYGKQKDGIGSHLGKIEQVYLSNRNYREGIHQLSDLMRRHWSETQSVRLKPLTSYEMGYYFESENPTDLFRELNAWQFSRREPDENDFKDALCRCREVHSARLKARSGFRNRIARLLKPKMPERNETTKTQNALDALLERKE